MEFEAFDGRVVFTLAHRSLRSVIVREGLEAVVPEYKTFRDGSQAKILFDTLVTFLADTREITFPNLNGASPEENQFAALRDFWLFAQQNTDYRAIWDRYLERVTIDIQNVWIDLLNKRVDPRLQAPADNQPGAPADEELTLND